MYKRTSDSENYLNRTGSHATKPGSTGDTGEDHGPEFVTDVALVQARSKLIERLAQVQEETININRRLLLRLPYGEYQQLAVERSALGKEMQTIQKELGRQKAHIERIRRLKHQAHCEAFEAVARHRLSPAVFHAINIEAQEFLALADEVQPSHRSDPVDGDGSRYHTMNDAAISAKAQRLIQRRVVASVRTRQS